MQRPQPRTVGWRIASPLSPWSALNGQVPPSSSAKPNRHHIEIFPDLGLAAAPEWLAFASAPAHL